MKKFPTGKYGRQTLRFFPAPFHAPLRAFAALVFAWDDERVLLCDISDRGWTVPSGRVEPDEDSRTAVVREALEEAGAELTAPQYIGCYQIVERKETRWADCYAARVQNLVDIAMPAESRRRALASLDELPKMYHVWNELTEMVFLHSLEVVKRTPEPQS